MIALDGHVPKNQEEMAPDVKYRWVSRIGKRRAGRLLDGREHSEFPNQQEG